MSAAFEEVFGALISTGMLPQKAAQLLSQIALEGAAAIAKPEPSAGTLRVRKFRERQRALQKRDVTPTIYISQENQSSDLLPVTSSRSIPLEPPKEYNYQENKNPLVIPDSASAGPSDLFGYISFDKTITFSRPEITTLETKCYSLTNVYGTIRNLSESQWAASMRPEDRKRAVSNQVFKMHNNRIRKLAPKPGEKDQAAVDERDERIRQRDEGVAARERIFAKRRAAGDGT